MVGPFFEIARRDDQVPPGAGVDWRPMTRFAAQPAGLESRVVATRQVLLERGLGGSGGSVALGWRVAASVTFLGLAARLLSPSLGSVLIAGVLPDLGWERLYWRPARVGVLPLAAGPVSGRRFGSSVAAAADSDNAAAAPVSGADVRLLMDIAVAPVLRLGADVAQRYRVPRRVIDGNVASAIVGAVRLTIRNGHASTGAGLSLIAELLGRPELADAGTAAGSVTGDDPIGFRRRSCCLLYRVDEAGLCGDCILRRAC